MKALKMCGIILMAVLFIFGATVLAYPHLHGLSVDRELKQEAQSFIEIQSSEQQKPKPAPEVPPEETPELPPEKHTELWIAMQEYNSRIWHEKQEGLCDPWSYTQPSFTLGDYGLENEVFGVISVPKLNLEMPLYLGATAQHMADGAAQLSQTSLPIGGDNTNCVIAGHRGWYGASHFRYVTELQPGDEVIITNLWESLTYTVTETRIIMPNEVESILIQEGRDMITLLTCHPYASGGRQRFLVFCDRAIDTNK